MAPPVRVLAATAVLAVLLAGLPISGGGPLAGLPGRTVWTGTSPRVAPSAPLLAEDRLEARSDAAVPVNAWATYLQNPERTSANLAERTLSPSNASQLGVEWAVKTNGSDFGSPTVVNGTVYAGSWNGYEYAINASNGTVLWKTFLGTDPNCSWGDPMGVAGNAAIWNGTVYVGGGNDYWYALNQSNGSVLWKIKVINDSPSGGGYNWASPLLYNGFEYIGVASCIDSPLVQGQLLMVNLSGNHSVVHTFDSVPNGQVGATIWTTAAVDPAANVVWLATGNDDGSTVQNLSQSIIGLNASTLALLGSWQVPGVDGFDSDFGGGPILFHDASGRLLVGASNKNGVFYALNRSNVTTNGSWKPVWDVPLASGFSPSAFDGTTLYLGGDGDVYAIDPSNGSTEWTAPVGGFVYGAVAYADGLVVAGAGTNLTVINASSGRDLANLSTGALEIEGAPSIENGQVFYEAGDSGTSGAFYAAGIPLGPASVAATPPNGSAPLDVTLTGTATGGLPPYNFTWAFGDGGSGWGSAPTHRYDRSGQFDVSVLVRDGRGNTTTANRSVVVRAALVASVATTPRSGAAPWNVTFTGSGLNGSGPPYALSWSFGDGTPNATGPTVRHEYTAAGTYRATLTVTDPDRRVAQTNVTIDVTPSLNASLSATPTHGTAPLNVSFTADPSYGTPPYSVLWSFGDLSPNSTATNVSHSYLAPGNYTAVLTVTDARSERHVVSTTVQVLPPPLSAAIAESNSTAGCPAPSFTTTVTGAASGGTPPYAYAWTFGDGSAAVTGASATHAYLSSGTYEIVLTATDSGRSDRAVVTTNVTVHLAACVPAPATKAPSSGGGPAAWEYALGVGIGAAVAIGLAVLVLRRRTGRTR